jgi:hypothetical protein
MATHTENNSNDNNIDTDDRYSYDIQADKFYYEGIIPNIDAILAKCAEDSDELVDFTKLSEYLVHFFTKDLRYKAPELRAHLYKQMWTEIVAIFSKYDSIIFKPDFDNIKESFNVIFKDGF